MTKPLYLQERKPVFCRICERDEGAEVYAHNMKRKLCKRHYMQWKRGKVKLRQMPADFGQKLRKPVEERITGPGHPCQWCIDEGLPEPRLVVARGMCQTHYRRWKRHGSPTVVKPSAAEQFETAVEALTKLARKEDRIARAALRKMGVKW